MYVKERKGILPMVWKIAFPLVFMGVQGNTIIDTTQDYSIRCTKAPAG